MLQESCPNNCGKWVAKRDLENHILYLCEYSEVICENCEIKDRPLKSNFHHNCLKILKEKLKNLSI